MKRQYLVRILFLLFALHTIQITAPLSAQNINPIQGEEEYNATIRRADQYYSEEKYDRALYEYENALKLKPNEKYPADRVKSIKAILDEEKTKNILFEVAVTSGEKWFREGDYKKAKAEFENALRIDPTAQYPKDKLQQISKLWSDPEVDAAYAASIIKADDLFSQKKYHDAKSEYLKASDLKPYEQYPLDRIIEINEILARLHEMQSQYEGLIARADQQYNEQDYVNAKSTYQDASNIKPEEQYPKNRIKEIEDLLARLHAERESYDKIIALADKYYMEKEFEKARVEYEKALLMKPDDRYPKSMITKIDPMIEEIKRIQQEYDLALGNAASLFLKKDYAGALAAYQKASSLKPLEQLPKDKISEITRIMNDLADMQDKQQRYDVAIAKADSLFTLGNLESAKNTYQHAAEILTSEAYPKNRIKEIEAIISAQIAYEQSIAEADLFLSAKNYQSALDAYSMALTYKPGETYPQSRINEINTLLDGIKSLERSYNQTITQADSFFTSGDYENARLYYEKAASVRPAETYPKNRITEIDGILSERTRIQNEFNKFIAAADKLFDKSDYMGAMAQYKIASELKPDEEYPKGRINEINGILADKEAQAASEKAYQDAIAAGDAALKAREYLPARVHYEQALTVKPAETYPQAKIAEINTIMEEMEKLKSTEEAYAGAIALGDQYFSSGSYPEALEQYQKASGLKPTEKYPKEKIAGINAILADLREQQEAYDKAIAAGDRYFGEASYPLALTSYQNAATIKPGESYPKEKITEVEAIIRQQEIQRSYDEAIASADRYFREKDYSRSMQDYQKALEIKPGEQYPAGKIAEINALLQEKQALEEAYAQKIASGDEYFSKADYGNALTQFKDALALKPAETYPRNKVTEIEGILAERLAADQAYDKAIAAADASLQAQNYNEALVEYQNALKIKPQEAYPQQKINEINALLARIKETEDAYNTAIANADRFFAAKNYQEASAAYQQAKEIKPSEDYPDEKIKEIMRIQEELKKNNDYQFALSQGDKALDEKKYQDAIGFYQQAEGIKPNESYPKIKIAEINTLLASIQARQKQYDDAVATGDNFMNNKEYEKAKSSYESASAIYPDRPYPGDKIKEINVLLQGLQLQREYDAAVAKADQYFNSKDYDNARTEYQNALNLKPAETYPQARINEINNILAANAQAQQEAYEKAIAMGDEYLSQQDFKNAKVQYQNAIGIKPAEQYPRTHLKMVEDALLAKEAELKAAYVQVIAKADNLYTKKILDEAIDAYMEASAIKPDESYPVNMLNQIKKYIAEHAIYDLLTTPVVITNNTEKKFDFTPVDFKMRKNNYIVLKARVLSETKPKVYLNYGRDAARSGGIVLKSIQNNNLNDYIIRVSAQDPWYRIDNNWIKLYSEGGDIEVTYIQISTGD
jgi:tetratricopeptide (TPR) repeat protein